ncbi:MAG: hypothetical protein IH853_04790 [Bacteroidetes bacterium]|nr:hypothetical protein [Bacteroidota bacterium]MCH8244822.1 hypothetical protein [Bacteroidota bacterium]
MRRNPTALHTSNHVNFIVPTILVLMVALAPTVSAQGLTGGSIYSRFGIGQRESYSSPRAQAMGGGGLALRSVTFTNHANPASLSDQILTRFAGGLTYESLTESATGAKESRLASGYLNALQLSFPLKSRKLGIGISFEPYSRVSYRVDNAGIASIDPENESQESFVTSHTGNGGIQKISGGLGAALTPDLSIGIRADFLFGILEEKQQTDFQNVNLRDGNLASSTRLRGLTGTLGIRYVLSTLFSDQDALSLGATYTLPVSLAGERVFTIGQGESTDTLGTSVNGDVHLPWALGFGVAYQPNSIWTVVADIQYENWSAFESDLPLPGYVVGDTRGFSDRVRISAGGEVYPFARRSLNLFLQRVAFRLGGYIDQSYVTPDINQEIKAYGVTGGVSIPGITGGTSLDMHIDIGRRGTTDNGLIRDKFVRFGINVNFGDLWFDRARLR